MQHYHLLSREFHLRKTSFILGLTIPARLKLISLIILNAVLLAVENTNQQFPASNVAKENLKIEIKVSLIPRENIFSNKNQKFSVWKRPKLRDITMTHRPLPSWMSKSTKQSNTAEWWWNQKSEPVTSGSTRPTLTTWKSTRVDDTWFYFISFRFIYVKSCKYSHFDLHFISPIIQLPSLFPP